MSGCRMSKAAYDVVKLAAAAACLDCDAGLMRPEMKTGNKTSAVKAASVLRLGRVSFF